MKYAPLLSTAAALCALTLITGSAQGQTVQGQTVQGQAPDGADIAETSGFEAPILAETAEIDGVETPEAIPVIKKFKKKRGGFKRKRYKKKLYKKGFGPHDKFGHGHGVKKFKKKKFFHPISDPDYIDEGVEFDSAGNSMVVGAEYETQEFGPPVRIYSASQTTYLQRDCPQGTTLQDDDTCMITGEYRGDIYE